MTYDPREYNSNHPNVKAINKDTYGLEVIMADQVIAKSQPWAWEGIIPLDTSTLFAGFGGSGKSQLLLFLAAHVSAGKAFKAGGLVHQMPEGEVVLLSGEDDPEYQLVPRLVAAGATLSRVHIVKMMKRAGKPNALLDLDAHLILLEELVCLRRDAGSPVKLIVIDPVQYFTGEMRDYTSPVCRFIGSLNDLAKKYNLAIIMNKHLRKKGSGDGVSSAVDSVSGSGAWTTSPRSCWLIQRHPEKDGVILFLDLKGNLKKKSMQSYAYTIEQRSIDDPLNKGGKIETTALQWSEELENLTADEALSSVSIPPIEQAIRAFIIDTLVECGKNPNNGYMHSSTDLMKAAGIEGYTISHFYRIKAKMIAENLIREEMVGRVGKTKMVILCDPEMHTYSK